MNRKDEKLLREFLKKTINPLMFSKEREEYLQEQKVRQWVRTLITEVTSDMLLETLYEAKDMANPHPNTGINKLP